ncbi:MAG: hypothetical protein WCV92_03340 [Candidatus Buchananbacteria bacterium]|jgi:hypothetical protein
MLFKSKEIKAKEVISKGIVAGLIQAAFIILVCLFVLSAGAIFPANSPFVILGLVALLILLVISVAVSAVIIFAIPAYLFFQKKYKEALSYIGSALIVLLLIFVVFVSLALIF